MENKLEYIIEGVLVACEQNNLKPSDDMVLDCATRIWNTQFINVSKDTRAPLDTGATDKQIATMKKLFIEFKDGISKKEASDLIGKKIDTFKD